MVGRPGMRRILTVAAAVALLQPMLASLSPDLAGWRPDHGHVYAHGVPVEHTHPWDARASEGPAGPGQQGESDEGVAFVFDLDFFGSVLPSLLVANLVERPALAIRIERGGTLTLVAYASPPLSPPPRS